MSNAKKIQLRLVGLAGAVILATVLLLTPSTAMAQSSSTCDLNAMASLVDWANRQGYYGVHIDVHNCTVDITYENPSVPISGTASAPISGTSTVTTTTASAAAVPITVTRPVITSTLGSPYVIHSSDVITKLDYVRDDGERAPEVIGQELWVAELIQDAMKIDGYPITDAVQRIQLIAQALDAHRPATYDQLEQNVRYLIWYSNVSSHTLPLSYEEVYWDGESLLILTPTGLEMGEFTFDYAVAVQ